MKKAKITLILDRNGIMDIKIPGTLFVLTAICLIF